jgi:hypothetical protein
MLQSHTIKRSMLLVNKKKRYASQWNGLENLEKAHTTTI